MAAPVTPPRRENRTISYPNINVIAKAAFDRIVNGALEDASSISNTARSPGQALILPPFIGFISSLIRFPIALISELAIKIIGLTFQVAPIFPIIKACKTPLGYLLIPASILFIYSKNEMAVPHESRGIWNTTAITLIGLSAYLMGDLSTALVSVALFVAKFVFLIFLQRCVDPNAIHIGYEKRLISIFSLENAPLLLRAIRF